MGSLVHQKCAPQLPEYLLQSSAESLEHSLHVAALLHGDDSGVVLLVHPDQEGLLIVVPEAKQLSVFDQKDLKPHL